MPWPSSTADAFRGPKQAAQMSAKQRTGVRYLAMVATRRPWRRRRSGRKATGAEDRAGGEPGSIAGRAGGRMDGLVSWRAQERQKRCQKEEGKREEKKMVEQLVRSKRHWSTALPCLLSPHPCSLADVRARSSVLCDDVDFWSSSIMQLL